jgi:cytochrome b
VMMLVAPLILTQLFAVDGGSPFAGLRRTLLLVLIGQFVSLAVVARTIWGFVQAPPAALPASPVPSPRQMDLG